MIGNQYKDPTFILKMLIRIGKKVKNQLLKQGKMSSKRQPLYSEPTRSLK